MAQCTRTGQAEEDLIALWLYIAEDNPEAADRLLNRIDAACARIADAPMLGPARPDLAPEMRIFVVGRYLILYRQTIDGIEVVRVVHGARNLDNLA